MVRFFAGVFSVVVSFSERMEKSVLLDVNIFLFVEKNFSSSYPVLNVCVLIPTFALILSVLSGEKNITLDP